ncbi:MAG: O-methyltransferase [Promethearchaeota archaeon]|jgi:predicted O-methyltransferase YrrM
MMVLKIKALVKSIISKSFKIIINTFTGSFIFYNTVLKSIFWKNLIDNLTGYNIQNLMRNSVNILAANRLKSFSKNFNNMEEIVDLGFNFRFSLPYIPLSLNKNVCLKTFQNKYEIIEFLKLIEIIQPKIVLEIGTAIGGTLYLISRFSASNAILISVDLPEVLKGSITFSNNPLFLRNFVQKRQKVVVIRGNSHKFLTFQKIKKILKKRKLDVLFIDGDHSYEGVKKDFEMYKSLVKPGGLICFHDIVPGTSINVGGVPDFWRKIRENYDSQEIVKDWNQGGYGIGIIYIN